MTEQENRIEAIDRDGWRKEFVLAKPIIYVGSQEGSDVYLPGRDVPSRALQLLPLAANRLGYRLVNLANQEITLRPRAATGQSTARALASRGAAELGDGDSVELGGYTLVLRTGGIRSAACQVSIEMSSTRLTVSEPASGAVVIKNTGDRAGAQFKVELQGLEQKYYVIEPGPVLFPNVEKRVAFRLTHPRQPSPPAGEHTLTFVVTAPEAYPGESVVVTQKITIEPYFAHRVRVIAIDPSMSDFVLP